MERIHATDTLLDLSGRSGANGAGETELPYLSRGEHRDGNLPAAEDPRWGDHLGVAGERFKPGVHDPEHMLTPTQLEAAERLAKDGAMVNVMNPDRVGVDNADGVAIVRESPNSTGTPTAFVPLDATSETAVADALDIAASRVSSFEHGQVMLDGRESGLTVEAARAGLEEAGKRDGAVPDRVHCLLANGELFSWPE